jgi:hypothetical protein
VVQLSLERYWVARHPIRALRAGRKGGHISVDPTMRLASVHDLYRRRPQRLVEWAVGEQGGDALWMFLTKDSPTRPLKPSILGSGVSPVFAI